MEQNAKSPLVNAKARDCWFDNAKAFLIISVVIGHLANGLFSTSKPWVIALQQFIYVYHMPAFMIITGRFSKRRIDNNDWVTVVERVLLPYILFQAAMLITYNLFGKGGDFNVMIPLFGLWYLFNVALYGLITPHLKRFKFLLPLSVVIALAVGFLPGALYGGFHRLVTFYPYFLFGYYTKNYDFKICKKIPFRILCYAIFIGIGLYVLFYQKNVNFHLLGHDYTYFAIAKSMKWTLGETFLQAVLRYIIGFLSVFIVLGMLPTKKMFFSYVGANFTYVYVLHLFLIVALRNVDERFDILRILSDKYRLLVYCFSGVPIALILASKPIRMLTRFFVEPNINLRKLVSKLSKPEE